MKKIILLVFLLTLLSCKTIPSETDQPITTLFCYHDDCKQELLSLAQTSKDIVCAFYDLDYLSFVKTFNHKNALVVLEKDNRNKANNQLLHKKYDSSTNLMHNKFCVFDNIVWTGSWNPTNSNNYDNVVVIHSKSLAQNYRQEFGELWGGEEKKVIFPKVLFNHKSIENYFCPEDNCKEKVKAELQKAQNSIYFMLFSFTDDEIGGILVQKQKQGVKVEGLIERTQLNKWSEYEKIKEFTRLSQLPNLLHHKVFIIDEKIVITGSANPSKNGYTRNDENIIIIHDETTAKRYLEEFEHIKDLKNLS